MKKKKIVSLLLSLCLVLGLMMMPVLPVRATDTSNENVLDARNGVVEVLMTPKVDGKNLMEVLTGYENSYRGTGFLVGGENGTKTVITNYHVVSYGKYSEDQLQEALKKAGYQGNAKVTYEISVVVRRDVTISAKEINSSAAGDFSILEMEQPIYDRKPLVLADSSNVTTTQEVYTLGFPKKAETGQIDGLYTYDDVTVTNGRISKITDRVNTGAPISTILHTAVISGGNSGGPLVNVNGEVIGINTYGSESQVSEGIYVDDSGYYYSTEINEIAKVLDALGIEYMKAGESAPVDASQAQEESVPQEESESPAQTEAAETESPKLAELQSAVDGARTVSLDNMTDESAALFKSKLQAAESLLTAGGASDSEIDSAVKALNDAKDALQVKKDNTMPVILAAAAAVIVILVIVIIIVMSGKKKKQREEAERAAAVQRQQQQQHRTGQQTGGSQQWNQSRQTQQSFSQQTSSFAGGDGAGETSVLNDGAGETTVLGGGQSVPGAVLVRRKNNERITITKAVFKIGKERRKVDYCISDNTNVSRAHADIVCKNGEFFIIDNNATNGTSVNGVAVSGGQERKLNNNDVVKLADEEFQFKML